MLVIMALDGDNASHYAIGWCPAKGISCKVKVYRNIIVSLHLSIMEIFCMSGRSSMLKTFIITSRSVTLSYV